jgi:hypothetical protein
MVHSAGALLAAGAGGADSVSAGWLLLLPLRLVGIAVGGVLDLVGAILRLPARLVRAI